MNYCTFLDAAQPGFGHSQACLSVTGQPEELRVGVGSANCWLGTTGPRRHVTRLYRPTMLHSRASRIPLKVIRAATLVAKAGGTGSSAKVALIHTDQVTRYGDRCALASTILVVRSVELTASAEYVALTRAFLDVRLVRPYENGAIVQVLADTGLRDVEARLR